MDYFKHSEYQDKQALKQLKENSDWYLFLGIGLVVLGMLAIIYSFVSTIISVMYIGLALVIVGIFEGIKAFKINKWGNFFLHVFLGILYVVAGIFILGNPAVNAITLTLLLAIFFVFSGIFRIIFALSQKVQNKFLLFLNGLLTLGLGILLYIQWPFSGLWVIGTFVGIDAIFKGWSWILLSLEAKKIKISDTHAHQHDKHHDTQNDDIHKI